MGTKEFGWGIEKLRTLRQGSGWPEQKSRAKLAARPRFHRGVALMCAERLWWRCHRSLVSDYLTACCGFEVVHIVEPGKTEPHRLHRAARLVPNVRGRLIYDVEGEQTRLL